MSRFPTELFGLQNVRIGYAENPYTDMPETKKRTDEKEYPASDFGKPVYADVTFPETTYINEEGKSIKFTTIKLLTCIVTIDQSKNIVKTAIAGKSGTIKEYIGLGDYTVNINGIISGKNGEYPSTAVDNLKKMLLAPQSLEVVSWYLQQWDIDNIVVESYNIPQVAGGISQQPFTIKAVSDKPVSIILS